MHNNKIEATVMNLSGFSEAGCPCASFQALYVYFEKVGTHPTFLSFLFGLPAVLNS
jgi:hypothetical protein